LQNHLLTFATTQRLRRFARYWDLVGNSGNFVDTTPLLWNKKALPPPGRTAQAGPTAFAKPGENEDRDASPFHAFMRWSEWLHSRLGRTSSIALVRLMELLFEYLTDQLKLDPAPTAEVMFHDYLRGNHHDVPAFLKARLPTARSGPPGRKAAPAAARRQTRHRAIDHRSWPAAAP